MKFHFNYIYLLSLAAQSNRERPLLQLEAAIASCWVPDKTTKGNLVGFEGDTWKVILKVLVIVGVMVIQQLDLWFHSTFLSAEVTMVISLSNNEYAHGDQSAVKVVLDIRWYLHITDAASSSNFHHKICCRIRYVLFLVSTKMKHQEYSFGEVSKCSEIHLTYKSAISLSGYDTKPPQIERKLCNHWHISWK